MSGHKCIIFLSFLILLALHAEGAVESDLVPGPPSDCLKGPYHKDTPSSGEEEEFQECRSWEHVDSCCSVATTESIRLHKARELYNYTWDLCGALSPECEKFLKVRQNVLLLVRQLAIWLILMFANSMAMHRMFCHNIIIMCSSTVDYCCRCIIMSNDAIVKLYSPKRFECRIVC